MPESPLGLYLHIPFCLRKCPYCSFVSRPVDRDLAHRYIAALHRQIKWTSEQGLLEGRSVDTFFFGGGTPSVLAAGELAELLASCRQIFQQVDPGRECSIEVNPATVTEVDLRQLVRAGFNRISVGVQSFSDGELQLLGRPHSVEDARAVIRAARRAGFANLNIDLMYGLPGQTKEAWQKSLEKALQCEPEHLSLYELTIEEGTPFATRQEKGTLTLPPEDEVLAMMQLTGELTGRAGYCRYEISNYARSGRECRHNINYWENGEYIGLGAAAVSCVRGRRCSAYEDVEEFCNAVEAGRDPWSEIEELDKEARFRETVVMGLRMTQGVSVTSLKHRFGLDPVSYYGRTLRAFEAGGLLERVDDRLRLSSAGLKLANRVMAELV